MTRPIRAADFVSDKLVRRRRVRNAQQGFGEAHEDNALLAAQAVFGKENIEPAETAADPPRPKAEAPTSEWDEGVPES